MWEDPLVADVHRTREQLSAQFDLDVKAIFADLRRRQAALGSRLVSRKKPAEPAEAVDRGPRSTSGALSDSAAAVPGN
jgi:hypothetical protein